MIHDHVEGDVIMNIHDHLTLHVTYDVIARLIYYNAESLRRD